MNDKVSSVLKSNEEQKQIQSPANLKEYDTNQGKSEPLANTGKKPIIVDDLSSHLDFPDKSENLNLGSSMDNLDFNTFQKKKIE